MAPEIFDLFQPLLMRLPASGCYLHESVIIVCIMQEIKWEEFGELKDESREKM